MPYLILSDVHGNREALEAVLDHAQGRYDQILCLGDLVGYGADPNFAVDWARAHVAAIVRGNHDRTVSQDDSLSQVQKVTTAHRALSELEGGAGYISTASYQRSIVTLAAARGGK